MKKLPNILYYHSHDTGRYIQPYGYQVSTPNLQRLAEEGVLMRKAFCAAPTCSPSRAALFTGCASHSVGMLGLAHRGFSLDDLSQTMIHTLGDAGYSTVLCGIQHIVPHEEISTLGYEEVLVTDPIPDAEEASGSAISFLQNRDTARPFFLDVGVFETHRYQDGSFHKDECQRDGRYTMPPEPIPDTSATRADWADYCASAKSMDAGLGRIRQELEAQGILDDTLIIYTTDHGPAFPNMKCTLSDFGLQVSLIMRWPKLLNAGHVWDGMVSHTDIFATVCEMIGIDAPGWVQGNSLLTELKENSAGRDYIFAEVNHHAIYNPMRCVRSQRFKLICHYASEPGIALKCCDPGLTKQAFLSWDWEHWQYSDVELYDLYLDPAESRNLADHKDYAECRADLELRLSEWMKATNDPLAGKEAATVVS